MRRFSFSMYDDDNADYEGAATKHTSYNIDTVDATVDNLLYHFKTFLESCDYVFDINTRFESVNQE